MAINSGMPIKESILLFLHINKKSTITSRTNRINIFSAISNILWLTDPVNTRSLEIVPYFPGKTKIFSNAEKERKNINTLIIFFVFPGYSK